MSAAAQSLKSMVRQALLLCLVSVVILMMLFLQTYTYSPWGASEACPELFVPVAKKKDSAQIDADDCDEDVDISELEVDLCPMDDEDDDEEEEEEETDSFDESWTG